MRKHLKYFLSFILLIDSMNCFALSQDEKLWLGINSTQSLNDHWSTFVFAQLRTINKPHPIQVGLLEGGIGYFSAKDQSFWVGYRLSGQNPGNKFYLANRLFQQYIKEIRLKSSDQLVSRTRLEQIVHGNSNQIAVRLRQRLALQIEREFISKTKPFLYDEVFFQIHNTQYTANTFISENRIFIGFNYYTERKNWWEIGYINQYQMKTSQNSQNTMSHIVSLTYNLS